MGRNRREWPTTDIGQRYWLSGYYHGKSGKTVLFKKLAAENTRKVVQFCRANPALTIMQAIERGVDRSLS
jgi:HdeA/HdeB family